MVSPEDKGADVTALRRPHEKLSDEEIEDLYVRLRARLFQDVGESAFNKIVWLFWAAVAGLITALATTGHIEIK